MNLFEQVKSTLTMKQVVAHFGFTPNRSGFIPSLFRQERTPSCKIYFESNSFFDFSAGIGGDIIRLTAMILGTNNGEAAKYLCDAFSLSYPLSGRDNYREEMARRQAEQKRQQEREKEFWIELVREIDRLRFWEGVYRLALDRGFFEPFSGTWCFCAAELQSVGRKLDILCASDQRTYRRMKSYETDGLPSDYKAWRADCEKILKERFLLRV